MARSFTHLANIRAHEEDQIDQSILRALVESDESTCRIEVHLRLDEHEDDGSWRKVMDALHREVRKPLAVLLNPFR
jgi:hypothetical protein